MCIRDRTGTEASARKPSSSTVRMSSVPAAVLATNSRLWSAERASGRTGPDSKWYVLERSGAVAAGGGVGSLAEAEGSRLQAASADASAASRQAPRTALVRWTADGWRVGRVEVGGIMACGCEVILSGYDRGRGGAMIDVNAVDLRPPGLQVAATMPQVLF